MHNPKTRTADGRWKAAIGPRLKRQWDYVVQHSRTVYERHQLEDATSSTSKEYEIFSNMSEEMLEKHFLEHIDDSDIQSARNRMFMADACRRKRQKVEQLWDKPAGEEEEEGADEDAQKEHMNDYMKYQKMYATMTHESAPRRSSEES
jgi:hypothetical protein